MDDLFPDLQQQLNKLTVVRYDSIKSTNSQSNQRNCQTTQTKQDGKVSSFC